MDALLSFGLWNAIGATLLALVVAGIGCVCRRPAVMHALWLLVLLKLVTPPLWQVPITLPVSEAKPVPVAAVDDTLPSTPRKPAAEIVVMPPQIDTPPIAIDPAPKPVVPQPEPVLRDVIADVEPPMPSEQPSVYQLTWLDVVLTIWATGAMLYWLISAVRVARFCRVMRRLTLAPAELQERGRVLAARLGLRNAPFVYLVAVPISPMIWAFGSQPRLLLPSELWESLNDSQRDLLLAHELAHLCRRDHWVRVLELLVVGVYWWLPVSWWARRRLQESAELCCDACVVTSFPELAPDYAATLVDSAALLSRNRSPLPVGASGMSHVPLLRRRLTMILNGKTRHSLSWISFALLLIAGLVLLPLWLRPTEPVAAEAAPVDEGQVGDAEKDFNIARFYEKTGHPGSAHFYYEVVKRRYPGSPWADRAEKKLRELQSQVKEKEKPDQPPPKPAPNLAEELKLEFPQPPPAPAISRTPADLQDLRDDIELLQVKLRMEQSRLKVTASEMEIAGIRVAIAEKQHENKMLALEYLLIAQREFATHQSAHAIQTSQVQYVELQLKQAQRRYDEMQHQVTPPPANKNKGLTIEATPNAQDLFDRVFRDVGFINRGDFLQVKFVLTNKTRGKMLIETVGMSHALLSVNHSPEKKTLNPGDIADLIVCADTAQVKGPFEGTAFVTLAFYTPDSTKIERKSTVSLQVKLNSQGPAREADDARIKELERLAESLKKELDEAKRKAKESEALASQPREEEPIVSATRTLPIPYHCEVVGDKGEKGVRVLLLASRDKGKTWTVVKEGTPGKGQFVYEAEVDGDGLHWFKVAAEIDGQQYQTNRLEPSAGEPIPVPLKVRVIPMPMAREWGTGPGQSPLLKDPIKITVYNGTK